LEENFRQDFLKSKVIIMKFCFIGNEDCKGQDIIKAHILSQKATMLGLRNQNPKGQQVVIQLGSKKESEKYPKEVGWSKASTYRCFCADHDKKLFESIDNPVAINDITTEDLFYHSLRTFAYSFYRNRYEFDQSGSFRLDFHSLSNEASQLMKNGGIPRNIIHRNTKLTTYHSFRESFIKAHLRRDYSEFDFCTFSVNIPQLISSANFFELPNIAPVDGPQMATKGKYSPYSQNEVILLTVVPNGIDETRVIFCWKKNTVHSQYLMRKLRELGDDKLTKFASRIICQGENENSFINLGFWEFLKSEYKSVVENLLDTEFQLSYSIPQGLFFNFLDVKKIAGNFDIFKVGYKYLNR